MQVSWNNLVMTNRTIKERKLSTQKSSSPGKPTAQRAEGCLATDQSLNRVGDQRRPPRSPRAWT